MGFEGGGRGEVADYLGGCGRVEVVEVGGCDDDGDVVVVLVVGGGGVDGWREGGEGFERCAFVELRGEK